MASGEQLQRRIVALVRAFGILEPERTPCGQPIGPSAAHALSELAEAGALSQRELGARLGLEKSTVSRLAADLERRGWLVRRRDAEDARVLRLDLTDRGRELAGRIAASRLALFERLAARLPEDEQGTVARALDLLVGALRAQDRPAQRTSGARDGPADEQDA